MKRLLIIVSILFTAFTSFSQSCGYTLVDTVFANSATLITATTARINGDASNGDVAGTSVRLNYVRVGHTDTVSATTSWPTSIRNLTGLTPATQYVYYYALICGSQILNQSPRYFFTTLTQTITYTPMDAAGYQFKYFKADSGFKVPRLDTSLRRAPVTGGDIVYRPGDNTFYGYYSDCSCWRALATDSAGVIAALDLKVDSVTVSGDSLFWWNNNGVSHGYILPALANVWKLDGNTNGSYKTIGTLDAFNFGIVANNVQSGIIDLSTNSAGFGYGVLAVNAGAGNAAFGYGVLNSNSSGINNTGVGNAALSVNNIGDYNTSVGTFSMQNTSSGSNNTALGWQALKANTTASNNVAMGWNSLAANTTGASNIAIGNYSGLYTTTASNQFFLNNHNTTNYTGDTTKSLVYATFNANPLLQRFKIDGRFEVNDGTQSANSVFIGDANGVGKWALQSSIVTATPTLQQVATAGNTYSGALTFPQLYGSSAANGDLLIDGTSSATKATSYVDIQQVGGYVSINTTSAVNNLAIPLHIGASAYNPSVDPALLINRNVSDATGSGNAHCFVDATFVSRSGGIGYNSYDVFPIIGGASNNHIAGFQFRAELNNVGFTTGNTYGLYTQLINDAGTVTNNYGGYAANPTNTGTITNNYGFYAEAQTAGGTLNYAFYSAGATPNYFGGSTNFNTGFTIAGAATSRKLAVGNGTTFVASTETWALPGTSGNVLTSDGTNWTSAAPAASGVTTVGAFSASSQTNGATISSSTITFGPADATNPGMVSTNTQTFAGAKIFNGNVTFGLTGAAGKINFNRSSDGATLGDIFQGATYLTIDGSNGLEFQQGGFSGMRYSSTGFFVSIPSVGVATATALLHINTNQSTSASTAPLKFALASANIMATPERGAVEVKNNRLYYTDSTGTRYIIHAGGKPTIAAGAGAGTTPTISITGIDECGFISITTGTLPTLSAIVATVTFSSAYGATPRCVALTAANAITAALSGLGMVYIDQAGITTTTFDLTAGATALTAATAYKWYYTVTQ